MALVIKQSGTLGDSTRSVTESIQSGISFRCAAKIVAYSVEVSTGDIGFLFNSVANPLNPKFIRCLKQFNHNLVRIKQLGINW